MKWGLIARAEDRGLGNMTWEIHRNLHPDRTLVVDMGNLARGFAPHPERYPSSLTLPFTGGILDEDAVRWFLRGLDVVYSAETFYDWRIVEWAREEGCATVLHVMPEFWSSSYPHPTRVWNPTCWRHDTLPEGALVVPVPVALDRLRRGTYEAVEGRPLRVLHVGGHKAAHDRNGTHSLLMALRRVTRPMAVTIRGQDGRLSGTQVPKHVDLRLAGANMENYWSLYDEQDVMVMPRRYGGLCLPVQEALAAGVPVVMPHTPPNPETWPIIGIPAYDHGTIRCAPGEVPMVATGMADLASALDRLALEPGLLDERRAASMGWATSHSWDALRSTWLAELASAVLAARRES